MKYIKTYEEDINEPKVGDYVICEVKIGPIGGEMNLSNFVKENIGYLADIQGKYNPDYYVQYNNIPESVEYEVHVDGERRITFERNEIIHWSKNPQDLEIYIQANKYNL